MADKYPFADIEPNPMGWDAFGLPAEQYAIETGTHPAITTRKNIDTFKRQIMRLGFSYDWDRELNTTDPAYVKWTQWIFLQLYHRGLAYMADAAVWWCPSCGTVLWSEKKRNVRQAGLLKGPTGYQSVVVAPIRGISAGNLQRVETHLAREMAQDVTTSAAVQTYLDNHSGSSMAATGTPASESPTAAP